MFFFCSNRQCSGRQAKQEQMGFKMILRARRGTEVAQRKRLKKHDKNERHITQHPPPPYLERHVAKS
jgi:hypothetical protein